MGVFRKELLLLTVASYLEEGDLIDAYTSAKKYSEHWFKPFDEYERIAANLPSDALPKHYPRVTDGTLAALISETPMRIWGQLQTGRFVPLQNSSDYKEWKTEMANVIWTNKIIPNANLQANFFTKLQIALHKALIYGSQPTFSFMVANKSYIGSDFILPQIRDVKMEPGKVSAGDCSYIWLDRHYTKLQLKQIIEQAKNSEGHAGWDIEKLKEIVDSDQFTVQDQESQHSEARKATDFSKVVTFSTCFHYGYEAPFYTVYRSSSSSAEDKIVRRDSNRNRTGDIPINFMYNQQNLVNPYGVGQIELAGPTQNMVDFFVSAHSLATQQGLEPNIKIKGDPDKDGIDLDSLVHTPGGHWYVGKGDVEPVNPTTGVYNAFPEWMGMYKTQIMNLQGTSDATVPGGSSGDPRYSKTPASVKYQQERTNAKDNYLRQRTDEFVSGLAKNLLNICLHNMGGNEVLNVSEDQHAKLKSSGIEVPEDAMVITVEFDKLRDGEFKYDVDANSSVVKNDDETKDRVLETVQTLIAIPNIDQIMAEENKEIHIGELIQSYLNTSGLDNLEKVITELSDEKKAELMAMQQQAMAQMQSEGGEQAQAEAEVLEASEQVPADAVEVQPEGEGGRVERLVEILRGQGWEDERIAAYIERMNSVGGDQ